MVDFKQKKGQRQRNSQKRKKFMQNITKRQTKYGS